MKTVYIALLGALLVGTVGLGIACGGRADTAKATPTAETDTLAPEVHAQTTCPIMGGDISTEYYADYKGKRVYFCCPGCQETFNSDPDKYMQQLEDQGVTLEDAPTG